MAHYLVHPSQQRLPYQSVEDYLSNIQNFKIIESTLREGEQFANAFFNTDFGLEYIELTSPVASEQSRIDCETICKLGLKSKILTHVRCNLEDAKAAVATGVDGVDLVIGISSFLREHSHGKDMAAITKLLSKSLTMLRGIEVRFSSEDSFRSDLVDLLSLYKAVDAIGVDRVGVADTVGCATPRQVFELPSLSPLMLDGFYSPTNSHNDTECAIANAYAALEAGATHIDTSVLGIGERNGITARGGLLARMIVSSPDYVRSRYQLSQLKDLENLAAESVEINIPFNNLSRASGWNAIKSRSQQLGLSMSDDQYKILTAKIKQMADIRPLAIDDTDSIIRAHHHELENPA
ncbi:homocitrate synthase [Metarhizium guizhouense ARSEF 977]|uniref:Homocitrate synthase n=1 Tax=Metarhizium guizhouense (strain ARSEF 977) TaxID=1276136 RepID=A0A0B4HRJ0_METGA|nr:homocitrate synthase [Metarhizium guizhouense ARSEF 977]